MCVRENVGGDRPQSNRFRSTLRRLSPYSSFFQSMATTSAWLSLFRSLHLVMYGSSGRTREEKQWEWDPRVSLVARRRHICSSAFSPLLISFTHLQVLQLRVYVEPVVGGRHDLNRDKNERER